MISEKILEMQAPSTKRALLQSEEERRAFHLTPIPKESQVRDENGEVFLNHRALSYEETVVYSRMRYEAGERIHEMREDKTVRIDDAELKEKKQKAVSAFMDKFSVSAIRDKFKKLIESAFKPSHAEIMSEAMRKVREE